MDADVTTLESQFTIAWPIWAGGYPEPKEALEVLSSREDELFKTLASSGQSIQPEAGAWGLGDYVEIDGLSPPGPAPANSVTLGLTHIASSELFQRKIEPEQVLLFMNEALAGALEQFCKSAFASASEGADIYQVRCVTRVASEASGGNLIDRLLDDAGVRVALDPSARQLLVAAASLLAQKQSEREVLSSSMLFFAAIEWGLAAADTEEPPASLKSLADAFVMLTQEGQYAALGADVFASFPPTLSFDTDGVRGGQHYRLSDNLAAALGEMVVTDGDAFSATDVVRAVLQRAGSSSAEVSWLRQRLDGLDLSALDLEMALLPGVTTHAASDLWTVEDKLGYAEYARAIFHFLRDPRTKPPLTISVQAPWGGGKTSLMRMIQRELDPGGVQGAAPEPGSTSAAKAGETAVALLKEVDAIARGKPTPIELDLGKGGVYPTVWFNAWIYQSGKQTWAGLGEAIVRGISDRLSVAEREKFLLRLHLARVNPDAIRSKLYETASQRFLGALRGGAKWVVAGAAITAAAVLGVVSALVGAGGEVLGSTVAGSLLGGSAALLQTYAKSLQDAKVEPGQFSLKDYLDVPDYDNELGFVHKVTEDLRRILDLLPEVVGPDGVKHKAPIVLFIDDLDRCSPAKVAEVFEAINLFVAGEFPDCYVILGMDSEVVAAALQEAHKHVVAQLPAYSQQTAVGWRYMDKFVQLPFVIPPIDADAVKAYANHLAARENLAASEAQARAAHVDLDAAADRIDALKSEDGAPRDVKLGLEEAYGLGAPTGPDLAQEIIERTENRDFLDKQAELLSRDSGEIETLLAEAHLHFSKNPRELKRLVNVYRFYMLLRLAREARRQPVPTAQQMRNYVMLSLAWPEVFRWLRRSHTEWETDSAPGDVRERAVDTGRLLRALEELAAAPVERTISTGGHKETRPPSLEDWSVGLEALSGLSRASTPWVRDERLFQFFKNLRRDGDSASLAGGAGKGFW